MLRKPWKLALKGGAAMIAGALTMALPCASQQLANDKLSLTVNAETGSYQVAMPGGAIVLNARVGVQVDHRWLRSSDYPKHTAAQSQFRDALGSGREVTVTCNGLEGQPELVYLVQLYEQSPYGAVQVKVHNTTGKQISVQELRGVEAIGGAILNLDGRPSAPRLAPATLAGNRHPGWTTHHAIRRTLRVLS